MTSRAIPSNPWSMRWIGSTTSDADGRRMVRIHAVAFPVYLQRPSARVYRFAALMRELAYRNDGTFVALSEFQ